MELKLTVSMRGSTSLSTAIYMRYFDWFVLLIFIVSSGFNYKGGVIRLLFIYAPDSKYPIDISQYIATDPSLSRRIDI